MNKCVQYSEGDYIVCMKSRYLLTFIQQCHVTVRSLSVSLHNRSIKLFLAKKVDRAVPRNNETENMTVNLRYII
jgi:hypothetical protein